MNARIRNQNASLVLTATIVLMGLASAASQAQNFTVLHSFGTTNGTYPHGAVVQGPDGTLYGNVGGGGRFDQGQVFRMNPDGTGYTPLKDFIGADGAEPGAALLLSDNTLYGTTRLGGNTNLNGGRGYGTIFKLSTDGSGFTVLKQFTGSDGAVPICALVQLDGWLYGTTSGDPFQSDFGTIFKVRMDGSDYTVLKQFTPGNGGSSPPDTIAGLCLASGILYGTTARGGPNDVGSVFQINPDGTGFRVLTNFPSDCGPCKTTLVADGTTLYGATHGIDTVFKLNTDGTGFTVLKHFTPADGMLINADPVLAGNWLYGRTWCGGVSDSGVVFKLSTDGSAFTVIKAFTPAEELSGTPSFGEWYSGIAGLLVSGSTLIGTGNKGGPTGRGTIFSMNLDGSGYTVLNQFIGPDGKQPWSGVASGPDGTLYGTTFAGGYFDMGTVFKLNSDSTGYTVLQEFVGNRGFQPKAGLAIQGSTLFGTTSRLGWNGGGTMFRINTDSSGYSEFGSVTVGLDTVPVVSGDTLYFGVPHAGIFRMNTDGSGYRSVYDVEVVLPSSLLLVGSTLYGADQSSVEHIFRVETNGTNFRVLCSAGGAPGRTPNGPVVWGGSNTVFSADYGRNGLYGYIFKVIENGFYPLHWFTGGEDGGYPCAGLVMVGEMLFGTTCIGGSAGCGTVFQIHTNGTSFRVLKSFSGADGRYPYGNLAVIGANLYGTTMYGGTADQGTVFRLSLPALLPALLSGPSSQTAETGATVSFHARAEGVPPLTYTWFFNGTNFLGSGTNHVLRFAGVQASDAGFYTVVVSNLFDSVTSSPAMLSIIAPVPRRVVPGLTVLGQVGATLTIETTTSLDNGASWTSAGNVLLTNTPQWYFDVSDASAGRFYRTWQPGPATRPQLQIDLVPALTLTGTIGRSVRIDYINQFGPTDAWVTLDTVTLTTSPQLYFDVSSLHQPPRLWRLVALP